jgi:hypothetical protein
MTEYNLTSTLECVLRSDLEDADFRFSISMIATGTTVATTPTTFSEKRARLLSTTPAIVVKIRSVQCAPPCKITRQESFATLVSYPYRTSNLSFSSLLSRIGCSDLAIGVDTSTIARLYLEVPPWAFVFRV